MKITKLIKQTYLYISGTCVTTIPSSVQFFKNYEKAGYELSC